jgi:hypothetical protein
VNQCRRKKSVLGGARQVRDQDRLIGTYRLEGLRKAIRRNSFSSHRKPESIERATLTLCRASGRKLLFRLTAD